MCPNREQCSAGKCERPVSWIRHTQFAGNHPFCIDDAKREKDFGADNDNCWWEELCASTDIPTQPKHPTEVPVYEGLLKDLVGRVHRMRYDRVAEFYRLGVVELREQAAGDRMRGRHELADLLNEAADITEAMQKQFEQIYGLCEPHMNSE